MLVVEKGKIKYKLDKNIWNDILEFYKPTEQILKVSGNLDKKEWSKGYITLTANQFTKLRNVFSLTQHDVAYGIRGAIKNTLVLRSVKNEKLSDLTFSNCKRHIARADLFRSHFIALREELKLSNTDGTINKSFKNIREYLNLSSSEYKNADLESFTKGSKLFYLRKKIEKLGCLVFETEARKYPINKDEVSGIFVWYKTWPVIILNSRENSHQRRIFTLLHELYHFLKTKEAIGLKNKSFAIGKKDDESEANKFAINCLLPKEVYENKDKRVFNNLNMFLKLLKDNVQSFGVSEKAQVIKLMNEKLISSVLYEQWEKDYNKRIDYQKVKEENSNSSKKGFSRRDISRGKVLGTTYISLVFEAYEQNKYSLARVSDFLNVRYLVVDDVFNYWL